MRTPTDSRPCRSIAEAQADITATHLGRWARFTPKGPGTFVVDGGVYVPPAEPEKIDPLMAVIFISVLGFWAVAAFVIVGWERGWW